MSQTNLKMILLLKFLLLHALFCYNGMVSLAQLEVTPLKAYRVKILGTTKPNTSFVIYHNPRLEKRDEPVQETSITQSTSARRHKLVRRLVNAYE